MRRAEERRSASVMIRSSIKWSLAGNEVDCRMKASEPRTFSWISTKISMSAKRRTTPLVRGTPMPSAIACASAGLELPAISLMEPFLADMDASCLALLDTTFSISRYPRVRRVSMGEEISGTKCRWQPGTRLFPGKNRPKSPGVNGSMGAVGQRLGGRFRSGDRGAAFARGGGGRGRFCRRAVDHAGETSKTGLGDFP